VSSKSEVRQCWTIAWQLMSVEMARTAVGRTTIECCVRWCAKRCAGSDTVGMTSAESWTSARPTCSWCAVQQAASAASEAGSNRLSFELVKAPGHISCVCVFFYYTLSLGCHDVSSLPSHPLRSLRGMIILITLFLYDSCCRNRIGKYVLSL